MEQSCPGSFGAPGERAGRSTHGLVSRCADCGNYVEITPMQPGANVWRLEMHDLQGKTIRLEESGNPDADCLHPDTCEQCGADLYNLRFENAAPDVRAVCKGCGHTWLTGHLNG